jgi:hypothetical protein
MDNFTADHRTNKQIAVLTTAKFSALRQLFEFFVLTLPLPLHDIQRQRN